MAALSEDGRYGLNCGQQSADRITVLHVKLTETALRAIEGHQKCMVSKTGVYFGKKRARTVWLTQLVSAGEAQLPRTAKATKLAKLLTEQLSPPLMIILALCR